MPHILIVDDEPAIRSLLALSFARAGYAVTAAADAVEAAELFGSQAFDVVLSDIDMPRMNGHELARWIAGNHPTVPCVLMSAFGLDCEDCPFAGRCVLLQKPFSPKAAVALIARVLSRLPS